MAKRSILLKPWEASAFAEGRATAILRVMKVQPKMHIDGPRVPPMMLPVDSPLLRCPFGAPGDVLLCKEKWARDDEDGSIIYSESQEGDNLYNHHQAGILGRIRWRSSTQMPEWAVRTRRVIERVRVVQWEADREPSRIPIQRPYGSDPAPGSWCWLIETRAEQ